MMRRQVIVDTGALVAAIDRRDHFHAWIAVELATIEKPLLTCEAVITEACFLLQRVFGGQATLIEWLKRGVIEIPFCLVQEVQFIGELMERYQSVPMSLADACLVRLAELMPMSEILTPDSDFRIYRKEQNQMISVIMPTER